jgi:hypothetical protein
MVASGNLASNYIPSASLGDFWKTLVTCSFLAQLEHWTQHLVCGMNVSFILHSVAHKAINPLKNQRLALSADLISR